MRTRLTAAAILLATVAACSKPAPAPEATESAAPSAAASAAPMTLESLVGTYAVSDDKGNPVDTTVIRADGGYTETPVKGLPKSGVVKVVDGKSCFDPSGDEAETCFTHSPVAADGSFQVTDPKGVVLNVKPVTK